MYNVELGSCQEQERGTQLLCKLTRQIQTDTAKVSVPQQVVEIVGEQLEHKTQVIAEHELSL